LKKNLKSESKFEPNFPYFENQNWSQVSYFKF
jgi:hypothetical protein